MKHLFFTILLLISSLLSFSQVKLDSGLVAYYPFNGNVNDASGNGNNPVFNNTTLTTDRLGQANSAVNFNGIDNYIRIPNSPSLNLENQISLCVFVQVKGFYNGPCHANSILNKADADFQPGSYQLRFDDGPYTNYNNCNRSEVDTIHQNFYATNVISSPPGYTPYINKNQWYCLVYTCDGDTASLYVDGILKVLRIGPNNSFSNQYDLFLGRLNNSTFPYWFNGDMDEVRIYNRAINTDEINSLCQINATELPCNSWLQTATTPSFATVGDIDVTGNQLTVEALFNRSSAFDPSTDLGKLVSKNTGQTNVNYSLLPIQCEITTDVSGYVVTPQVCPPVYDKVNHAAMVYDGLFLKFYRNGFLLESVACTGNLINNDLLTTIGQIAGNGYPDFTQFKGYINEVRIWNVARSQEDIRANMSTVLLNPATQPGLLADYIFNDLINKQGNVIYNGSLAGNASIGAINPNCTFLADSCSSVLPVTLVNFAALALNDQIKLTWNVAEQQGINNYTIERSTDGFSDFITIGNINAWNTYSYSLTDSNVKTDKYYFYRVVIVGKDLTRKYSNVIIAKIIGQEELVTIYPNPSFGSINILTNNYTGKANFSVLNSVGQLLLTKNEIIKINEPISINISGKPKGIYWLKTVINDKVTMKKILIK